MISEIILGTVVPALLFYNYTSFGSVCNDVGNCLLQFSNMYFRILNKTQEDHKDNLCIQICSPTIALYKSFKIIVDFLYQEYLFSCNKNIHIYNNKYLVEYTLHGKEYLIIMNKKNESLHEIVEAIGIKKYTTCRAELVQKYTDDDLFLYNNSTSSSEVEDEEQAVEEQSNEEQVVEEQVNEEQVNEEQVNDEQVDEEFDITLSLIKLYGPFHNFHNSKITPSLLGFDKVTIKYLNSDTIDLDTKTFEKDDLIRL